MCVFLVCFHFFWFACPWFGSRQSIVNHTCKSFQASFQDDEQEDPDTASFLASLSDSDSMDSDIINYFVDFDNVIGREIVIWSYVKPKVLHLFKPSAVDTLESLAKYVKHTMDYNHHCQRLTILFPNELHPQDIGDVVTLKMGTSMLILPKKPCDITIIIHKLNTKFELDTDLCSHVFIIKQVIEAEFGFPVLQQDLLHKDNCLENQSRLYQWGITSQSVLDLHLHYQYSLQVSVKTFWKTGYELFVDPCMMVSEVLDIILKRCISPHVCDNTSILEDFMIPRHLFVLTVKGRTLAHESTLGFCCIHDGDSLFLTTIGRQYRINVNPMEVNLNDGRSARIVVSHFDTWAIIAFHMHGITTIPIDKVRLYNNNKPVNYSKTIGTEVCENVEIRYPEKTRKHPQRLKSKQLSPSEVSVLVDLGSGVTESIKCTEIMTMADIKDRLKNMGVPNAQHYYLKTNHGSLPDTVQLKHFNKTNLTSLKFILKLEQFPVYINLPRGQLTITVHVTQTIGNILEMIEKKSKLSLTLQKLLLAGYELTEDPETTAYDSELTIGTVLYMVPKQRVLTFSVHSDTTVTNLKLPHNLVAEQIKPTIWKAENLSSTCLTSMETFLKWHLSLVNPTARNHPINSLLPSTGSLSYIHNLAPQVYNTPNRPRHPEISPTTGTVRNPQKSVQFKDVQKDMRPKAAKSTRKIASIVMPVFHSESQEPAPDTPMDLPDISMRHRTCASNSHVALEKLQVSDEQEKQKAASTSTGIF